jgi:hypothetical protein
MAETRAKARALRDAINVGVTAFEELGDESSETVPARSQEQQASGQPVSSSRAVGEQAGEGRNELPKEALPATRKQLNYLEALIADVVEDGVAKFEDMVGKPISELTRGEASEWIGRLSGRAA